MRRDPAFEWLFVAHDAWWLWAESLMVISMRTSGALMGQPGTGREMQRMVAEKLRAAALLPVALSGAGSASPAETAHKAVRHYRKRVSANRRRLARQR